MGTYKKYMSSSFPGEKMIKFGSRKYMGIGIIVLFLSFLSPSHPRVTPLAAASTCPTPDADMINYAAIPPFITGGNVKPNILILLDNSGSMNEFAYKIPGTSASDANPDTSYDPNRIYYGYFVSNSMYLYDTDAGGHFRVDSTKNLDTTSFWSGNFLNWLTMRRVDIVRKVLVGGKATNRAINFPKYVLAHENPDRDFWKAGPDGQLYYVGGDLRVCQPSDSGGTCATDNDYTNGIDSFNVKVFAAGAGEDPPGGIVQQVEDRARFGLMFFNHGNRYSQEAFNDKSKNDGGYLAVNVMDNAATNLLTQIENTDPSSWAPLGESLYEAIRVFQGDRSAYTSVTYDNDPSDPLAVGTSCQKNFILVVSDGDSTKDKNVPGTFWSANDEVSDPYGFDVGAWMDKIAAHEGVIPGKWTQEANTADGTYYAEGVAYYAHSTDLRTASMGRFDIEGKQNLNIFTVFAFGESYAGRELLQKTAKYGGFEDRNGNGKPDGPEWDAVDSYGYGYPDGIPDNYYEAQDSANLGPTLLKALLDIFKRSASGSSTSVITTTGEGEGAVYQAFFYPKKKFDGSEEIKWVGFLNGLFVDPFGNIREDTNGNETLDMTTDKIVKMRYDPGIGTLVDLYLDSGSGTASQDGDGIPNDCVSGTQFCADSSGLKLEDVRSLWEAGSELQKKSASSRVIITEDPAGTQNPYYFVESNASDIADLLRAADQTEAENIINWVRGVDDPNTGYRSRTVTHIDPFSINTNGTWKLGDIINSSPTTIGRPGENYGFIYADYTYGVFANKYDRRRITVYVGANDGMLHAFNAGYFDKSTKKFYRAYDGSTYSDSGSHPALGEELWGYVPRSMLPHLKWLTREDYAHVYYVDMTPKVADVRIFTSEYNNGTGTHPHGWGTILIGGMRLGGKTICTANETLTAEYFALDVTDPQSPRFLWRFIPDNGGVTMSRPAIVRIRSGSAASDDKWFMVVGSGPINYDGFSNITALNDGEIYIVDLETGVLVRKFTTSESKAFFADPIAVDVNLDYKIDVAYIGESYLQGTAYDGKMYRLNTKNNPDPDTWTLSVLHSMSEPITAASTAALDDKGSLWIFFGTGKFIGTLDKNHTDSGKFFGIKDGARPWLPSSWDDSPDDTASSSNLLDVSNATVNYGGGTVSVSGTSTITNWSTLQAEVDNSDGWFIDHATMSLSSDFLGNTLNHAGERVFVKPAVLGGLVVWSTYIPGIDLCSYEGESNVYSVFYKTGTAYFKKYLFSDEYALEKSSSNPQDEDVSRVKKLGLGMPATIGTMITREGNLRGFSQQSTGTILEIDAITPLSVTSGISGWKEDEL